MSRPPSAANELVSLAAGLTPAIKVSCGLVLGVWAMVPAGAQESAADTVFDVTDVTVVNVEVVVTDSRGERVSGLTRDDFVLLENGEPVEVSNFYAMENGAAVSPAASTAAPEAPPGQGVETVAPIVRPIHLVIYVDTANIAKVNRAKVLNRVREFLLAEWRQGLRVMLVSNEGPAAGAAVIRQGFTSVPHDLFVALEEISEQALAGPRLDQDRVLLQNDMAAIHNNTQRGLSTADAELRSYEQEVQAEVQLIAQRIAVYSQQALVAVRRTLGTLTHFVETMAGMPGRKSILYVSDGLDVTPGADLFAVLRGYQSITDLGAGFSSQADSDRLNARRDVEKLIASANDHRVTLNILDASPSPVAAAGAAEFDRVSGTTTGTWNVSQGSIVGRNRVEPLLAIAGETGGRAGIGLSAVGKTLGGILADFDNHYSLGYTADRVDEGQSRTIRVEVKGRRDLRVRHRSSVRDKTLGERATERARAALLIDDFAGSGIDDNPLDVALIRRPLEPQPDGQFVVPVLVTIPLGELVLIPGEGLHQAQVSMFVAVRDDQGRTSEVNQHLCPIRIPDADVPTALAHRATCGLRLLMRGGPQRLAVSVLDAAAAVHSTVRLDLDVGAEAAAAAEEQGAAP